MSATALARELAETGLYTEFASWKNSTSDYTSALSLWSDHLTTFGLSLDNPCRATIHGFARLFRNGKSLSNYLSHLRQIYKLLDLQLGHLHEECCKNLVKGAIKLTDPEVLREKRAATAKQTKQLVNWLHRQGQHDVADSFVVCRQYALRYKSECVPLQWHCKQSHVHTDVKCVTINTCRKTSGRNVIPISRNCICAQQSSTLCGTCILRKRYQNNDGGYVFPHITYASAMYWLREGAAALSWQNPASWGTHCFRRGWGRDAYNAGGMSALFISGGWSSVAATGYMSSKQRNEIEACNFHVDFSDEEEPW